MKTILIPLAKFFDSYLGSFAKNVLSSLGIGIITTAGIKTAFDTLVTYTRTHFDSIAIDALQLVGLAGIGEAIGLIVGAVTFRLTYTAVSKLGVIPK